MVYWVINVFICEKEDGNANGDDGYDNGDDDYTNGDEGYKCHLFSITPRNGKKKHPSPNE